MSMNQMQERPATVPYELTNKLVAEYEVGDIKFSALGDRVVVLEDEFKSGYECEKCNGAGHLTCSECKGTRKHPFNLNMLCKECAGQGSTSCPECKGKGGLIVVPDASQRRPTTGTIVSAGENCQVLTVGQNVMYSNFAGYAVDLNRAGRAICLRILHETEILCKISGHLELRTLRNTTEVTSI